MKPSFRNTVIKHISAWVLWFGLNSITIFGSNVPLNGAFWLQTSANFATLVLMYYAVFFVMRNLYNRFDFGKYQILGLHNRFFYLVKAEVLAVIALIVAYTAFSIWYDRILGYQYPNVLAHIDKRFTRLLPYVMFSGLNSFYVWYQQRQKQLARLNKMRYKKLEKDTQQIRDLYKKLTDLRTLN
jgi:hypothetical protein